MSLDGPRLTTWALQQVVSFLGYTSRAADVAAMAESDPSRKSIWQYSNQDHIGFWRNGRAFCGPLQDAKRPRLKRRGGLYEPPKFNG
jgi:hypothetical protein